MKPVQENTLCVKCNRRSKAMLCKRCSLLAEASTLSQLAECGALSEFHVHLRGMALRRGGMRWLSEQTGLSREGLYRSLSEKGNLRLSSLMKILEALGLRMFVEFTGLCPEPRDF